MAIPRYFWRAPWMSVPIGQGNFQRTEEAPQMDLLVPPFKEDFKGEVGTPWMTGLLKRNFKKMDGRIRILKHI